MLEELKKQVFEENLRLVESGLVVLTWGNVSGYDTDSKLMAIKPSGVSYSKMKWEDIVIVDMEGNVVEGDLNPSSDTPTHIELYKAWGDKGVNGVVHTHSVEATAWAQAGKSIPCYGTTHADHFYGPVPHTRILTNEEVEQAYELNTGKVILECFADKDPVALPGVLVNGHAPFTWGANATKAVDNAVALESMAKMARLTQQVSSQTETNNLPQYVLDKHYNRKHGENAYYGQNK